MLRASAALLIISLSFAGWGGSPEAPADGQSLPGWMRSGKPARFIGTALFDHIDGGAEIFLEFGFRKLLIRKYRKNQDELSLELYEMDTPESAMGIYLMKSGRETPVPGIESRNTGETAQFTILKGRFFIQINNFSLNAACVPAMVELANKALSAVTAEKAADLTAILPREGLVPGSAILFRGPVGLQSLFYFGDGDILLQKGKIFGAAGTYAGSDDARSLVLIVDYPRDKDGREAFDNLRRRLDSYLRIISEDQTGFIFEDFQKKFGDAQMEGHRLVLRTNLTTKPCRMEKPRT